MCYHGDIIPTGMNLRTYYVHISLDVSFCFLYRCIELVNLAQPNKGILLNGTSIIRTAILFLVTCKHT